MEHIVKEKVFSYFEKSSDGVVELETLVTSIPALAPESGGQGELDKALALEMWLKAHGISDIVRMDAKDDRVVSGLRPNLVATIKGKNDKSRLWIMSHLDVVPEGERSLWQSDPWKVIVKDGAVVGRGVEDNQQGLVASVFAALAFVKQGIVPERTIKLLFVADEEVGSKFGIQHLINNYSLFNKEDIILIPDGGNAEGTEIEVAEKNICWLKVRTKGLQTHAASPDKGVNAFLAASDLAVRIHNLENTVFTARNALFEPDRTTINPTKKEANVPNVNTIPGQDVFHLDCRVLPSYPLEVIEQEIRLVCDDVEAERGVRITFAPVVREQAAPATPADCEAARRLTAALEKTRGLEARAIGIGGGTVAAAFRKRGLPAVCWSTLMHTAHQPNEHASVKATLADSQVFAHLLFEEQA